MLKSIGINNVTNIGYPTMWNFTPEFCGSIPKVKSNKVVCDATNVMDKKEFDKKVLDILFENYEEVYYWIQGDTDYDNIKEIGLESKVNIIYSDLNEYTNFLKNNNCNYV